MQIRELKSKLNEEKTESNLSVKEELVVSESDEKVKVMEMEQSETAVGGSDTAKELSNDDSFKDGESGGGTRVSVFPDMKDGSSDNDSSAIFNEDNSPNAATISSSGILQSSHHHHHHHHLLMSPTSSTLRFNCFPFSDSTSRPILGSTQKAYQPQFVKMEEHNFFSVDESCNFFPI